MPSIAIKYVADYDIENIRNSMFSALEELGGIKKFIKSTDTVVIKANLCGKYSPDKAITTHPNVIQAVAEQIISTGAHCILVDNSNIMFNEHKIDKVYDKTGMFDLTLSTNIELNKDFSYKTVEIDGVQTKSLNILSVIENADVIINVSKLKTSTQTGLCGCVENLMGCIPYKFQKQISTLYKTLNRYSNYNIDVEEHLHSKIKLNIVDAVVAMEGPGPVNGTPRILNRLVVGIDPYLTDLVCLSMIDYPIVKMPLIIEATKRNKFPFYNNLLNDIDSAKNVRIENMEITKYNKELIDKFSTLSEIAQPATQDFSIVAVDNYTKPSSLSSFSEQRYSKTHNKIPRINCNKCRGCSICYNVCPTHAITMEHDKNGELYAKIDYDKCIYCYKCVLACQYGVANAKEPAGYKKINKPKEQK